LITCGWNQVSAIYAIDGCDGERMKDFDLVIFDCDGVLVDSEVLSCQCLVDVLGQYGVIIGLDEAFERFLGRSSSAVEEYYTATTGTALPRQFGSDLHDHMVSAFKISLQLIPHIRSVLDSIDRPYCLASSSDGDRIRMSLSIAQLETYFGDRIYCAAMVARSKPAPDLFLFAAAGMGARAAQTLVIEDSVNGVLAGKAAGMTVWGFVGGSHYSGRDGQRLLADAGADRIFGSMADFMPA
jgi:HAD superfamily hydrolase (TIGR01509 family)